MARGGQQERQGLFSDLIFYTALAEFLFLIFWFKWPTIWPNLALVEHDLPIVFWAFPGMLIIAAFGLITFYRIAILWRASGQKRGVEDSQ